MKDRRKRGEGSSSSSGGGGGVAGRGKGGSNSRPRSASASPPLSPPSKRPRSIGASRPHSASAIAASIHQHHSATIHSASRAAALGVVQDRQHRVPIVTLGHLPRIPSDIGPDIDHHHHHHPHHRPPTMDHQQPSDHRGAGDNNNDPSSSESEPGSSSAANASADLAFLAASMQQRRAAELPHYPVVNIPMLEANPPDPRALAIYTNIVRFVDEAPDLARLALVSKLVHVPAMKRLWSGPFFPSIGYFSVSPKQGLAIGFSPRACLGSHLLRTACHIWA